MTVGEGQSLYGGPPSPSHYRSRLLLSPLSLPATVALVVDGHSSSSCSAAGRRWQMVVWVREMKMDSRGDDPRAAIEGHGIVKPNSSSSLFFISRTPRQLRRESPKPPPTQDSTPATATTKTRTNPPGNPNSSFIFLIHHPPRGHSSFFIPALKLKEKELLTLIHHSSSSFFISREAICSPTPETVLHPCSFSPTRRPPANTDDVVACRRRRTLARATTKTRTSPPGYTWPIPLAYRHITDLLGIFNCSLLLNVTAGVLVFASYSVLVFACFMIVRSLIILLAVYAFIKLIASFMKQAS
ncbi:hypothetical protein Dimus_031464 [Dionaea muscipula]